MAATTAAPRAMVAARVVRARASGASSRAVASSARSSVPTAATRNAPRASPAARIAPRSRAAPRAALLGDQEDKDLWDELEQEAIALAGNDERLWQKVQALPGKNNAQPKAIPTKQQQELEEDLFGASAEFAAKSLQIQKADFTVNSIIDKINRNKVNLRPSYQREYVWTVRTASKLVESLMLNIPIPTMFFHEVDGGCLEVVDGKQRLTSVWSFIQGEFPDGTKFKLKGLEVFDELNGKTFEDLPEELKERILDHPLNVHTISRQSQPDFVFEVFERLNMGATQLNEQELRNCIYQGLYTDLLCELAEDEHLLSCYRSNQPHLRMKDRELILRFFAMQRTTPSGFSSPIKSWLNEEIRENKDMTPQEAKEMAATFRGAIKIAWEVFGECAFRPVAPVKKGKGPSEADVSGIFYRDFFENGEINVALWDTVMYAFAGRSEKEVLPRREKVLAAFIKLAGSPTFKRLLVSQPKAVEARAEAWGTIVDSICGERASGAKAAAAKGGKKSRG